MGEPVEARLWIDGQRLEVSLDYEFTANLTLQGLSMEISLRPEGIELGLRGGPLEPARLLGLIEAMHKAGKTRDLIGVMVNYPVKVKLLGVTIKIPPVEKK